MTTSIMPTNGNSLTEIKSFLENVTFGNIPQEVLEGDSQYNPAESFYEQFTNAVIAKVKKVRIQNKKELMATSNKGIVENLFNGLTYENDVRISTPDKLNFKARCEKAHKEAEKMFQQVSAVDNSQGAICINKKQVGACYGGKILLNTNAHKKANQITELQLFGDATTVSKKIEDAYLFTGKRR